MELNLSSPTPNQPSPNLPVSQTPHSKTMSTPPGSISIYQHPHALETLAPHLAAHLPIIICLQRRIQFHAQSPDARIYATFAPGSHPPGTKTKAETQIWSAAFVDRSRAPETECWIFSSVELLSSKLSETQIAEVRRQLVALFAKIRALGVPDVFAEQTSGQPEKYLIVGAVHEVTLSLLTGISAAELKASGQEASEHWTVTENAGPVVRYTNPWITFLYSIDVKDFSAERQESFTSSPSADLVWTTVRADEFALVRSRTSIPRRDRTLVLLPSAGLRTRDEGKLISWAFLGADGGLTSLHVEPEYRGRGLGKAVAGQVLGLLGKGIVDGKGFFGLDSEIATGRVSSYSHTAVDNLGSIGVAKGLGGREAWIAYWVTVDLSRLDLE